MRRLTTEEFIARARAVHGDRYDYSKAEYVNNYTKVCIICPEHGEFWQRPSDHLRPNGCPYCGGNIAIRQNVDHLKCPKGSRLIPLTKGKNAIVDAEDYARVIEYTWYFSNDGYACSNKVGRMHRFILEYRGDMDVDHKNLNKIDNRKDNLRLASRSYNNANRTPKKASSLYKGVSWHKGAKKWRVVISKEDIYYHVGYFTDEIEAAKAYDRKAVELFGDFARTNLKQFGANYRKVSKENTVSA